MASLALSVVPCVQANPLAALRVPSNLFADFQRNLVHQNMTSDEFERRQGANDASLDRRHSASTWRDLGIRTVSSPQPPAATAPPQPDQRLSAALVHLLMPRHATCTHAYGRAFHDVLHNLCRGASRARTTEWEK